MKNIRKISLICLWTLLAFSACGKNPKKIENDFPQFVAIVTTRDKNDKLIGFANATVVDNQNGFLVTSAHVLKNAEIVDVKLPSGWYRAEWREEWINWQADIALIKTPEKLPQEGQLAKKLPPIGSLIKINGYLLKIVESDGAKIYKFNWQAVSGSLNKLKADFCITIKNCEFALKITVFFLENGYLPKEFAHFLYDNYIHVTQVGSAAWLQSGLSGSPSLDDKNQIVGIVSNGNEYHALIVPAEEIEKLLKKAKSG